MRKFLKITLCFALIFMLCGCNDSEFNPVVFVSSSDKNDIKIGMSVPCENTFLNNVCDSAKKAAASHNITLEILSADNNMQTQLEQIIKWSDDGYAAVIVILCDDSAGSQVLENAGIMPVAFVNRCPSDRSILQSKQNVIYIGGEDAEAGRLQGEFLSEIFISRSNSTPTIAVICGNDSTSDIRIAAAKEAMANAGLMPFYIYEHSENWDKAQAETNFYDFLKHKPAVNAVLAANDDMAIGASNALAQAGYALSEIPIAGIDATLEGRTALRYGKIDFTVYQNPDEQGAGAVNELMNMLDGKTPNVDEDSIYQLEYTPVTAANVDRLFPDDK